ncbi:MAG: mandelate racemase/muconate lactonizing enzyme family protein [Rhodospirillaceae bacterium]|nr:mandelate racemase/muconate lactonizing enzyme family protein [Rhodospirillaceae bacterium]
MKIKSVEARWLHVPIPEDKQHRSDFGLHTSFDTTLVRIETDTGLVGWGEAKAAVGGSGTYGALTTIINEDLAPVVIGQDPRDPARLWEEMYNRSRAHYALRRGHVFPDLARRGITICGMSGIDIALWDILGKHLGVPVWQLLGGRTHDWLPAYASGGWAPADRIGQELQGYIDKGGFKAVKMRVGIQDETVNNSAQRVQAARDALGPDIAIMADAHCTFTARDALRFARKVTDCDLAWFEEPVSADDLEGQAELRRATDIPIAAGESLFTRFDFRDNIQARAIDILQPDPAICGGITETARIATLASAHQVRLAPHLWGGAIMFAAGFHVCIADPSAFILEYSLGHNPMQHELAANMFPIADGGMAAPEAPGLGIEINEDFVRRTTR